MTNKTAIPKQTISEEQFLYLQQINIEYEQAFIMLNQMPPYAVTIYGGSKIKEEDKLYKDIENLAFELAKSGYAVATGGGPGAMKAGIVGANRAGGTSVACKINITKEKSEKIATLEGMFTNFAPRKYMLRQSDAYIFVPGGWGTFDELFEVITLQKVDKTSPKPIFLYKKDFWEEMLTWLKVSSLKPGLITKEEFDSLYVVDNIEEVITIINSK
jgi:uncharacterized protein (TIGR00730 family)